MNLRPLACVLLPMALWGQDAADSEPSAMALAGRTHLPEQGATVPLVPGMELPTVEVYLGDAGPYRFIVEWAGNILAVSEKVRVEAGLDVLGVSPMGSDLVAVPRIRVGQADFEDLVADVMPFFAETDHDGALGLNVFHELVGTLDFPAQELRLSRTPLASPHEDPAVVAYSPGPGGTPRIPIELGGQPFHAVLDTAADTALILDEIYLDQLPLVGELRAGPQVLEPVMGVLETRLGTIAGELVIGDLRISQPVGLFHSMEEPEILLGGGFLRDYALTLDQGNRRLKLTKKGKE